MLKEKSGIVYAELLAERDGDACTYMIESAVGVDIRKSLFYTLAERGWPLIGLESLGMNLEDIFITIVDTTDGGKRERVRRGKSGRSTIESEVAKNIMKNTASSRIDALGNESEDN